MKAAEQKCKGNPQIKKMNIDYTFDLVSFAVLKVHSNSSPQNCQNL